MTTKIIKELFFNRNLLLILSVFAGFLFGDLAFYTKDYVFSLLILIMIFSSSGIATKAIFPLKSVIKPMLRGIYLNYIVFGIVMISLAYFLISDINIFYGFVVIAATPPGVIILPFTVKSKGDLKYSTIGLLAGFLASVALTPLIIDLFTENASISSMELVFLMVKMVIIPLLVSRLLLFPKIEKVSNKIKGRLTDYSFAIIIFTAVGMNRTIFYSNFSMLISASLVLIISMFVLGAIFYFFKQKQGGNSEILTSETLLLTIKSSGFAVVTSLELFGKSATIPAALLSIFVLLFVLAFSVFKSLKR